MKFYVISPPDYNLNFNIENFEKITGIIPVNFFQFRPKFPSLKKRLQFVDEYYEGVRYVCKKKKIKLIINNDFEIAEHYYFDGIHLGENDRSCIEAKKKFGKNFIVGVSCMNSFVKYKKALKQGADYVAFGSVFKSKTKSKKAIYPDNIVVIKKKIKLPFTLIGGINHNNILSLKDLKPNNVAVISSIWNYENDPIFSANLFKKILGKVI